MAASSTAGQPALVNVAGLTWTFVALIAVDHVTLAIGEGEIFGIIGPNGAGNARH